MSGTPAAEVETDEALVRALLADQHPDLAGLAITPLDAGWDNAMFRLGEDYLVRLPRRAAAAPLLEAEQRWLAELAAPLAVAAPVPVRTGAPALGYPWRWSVLPWIEGEPADLAPLEASEATPLAAALRALHRPAPSDAPASAVRGCPLAGRVEGIEERMARRAAHIPAAAREAWDAAIAAPAHAGRVWLHGDLHARNVLTREGRLAGFIDWGDLCAGDPASDLAAFWMLLPDPASRAQAIAAYGADDKALWVRAKGWAVLFGVLLIDTGLVDHPRHAAMGVATLKAVEEGP